MVEELSTPLDETYSAPPDRTSVPYALPA